MICHFYIPPSNYVVVISIQGCAVSSWGSTCTCLVGKNLPAVSLESRHNMHRCTKLCAKRNTAVIIRAVMYLVNTSGKETYP